MLAQQKVVTMENDNMKILGIVQDYFKDLNRRNRDYDEKDCTNTTKAYEGDIRLFFHLIRGKKKGSELEYLTMEDIKIEQDDFEEYIDVLCDLKNESGKNLYVNKTVNRKITSLKSFIKYLKKKKVIDIDISYLSLIKGEKEKKNSYGVLTTNEVLEMADWAYQERNKGEVKYYLIHTAFKTGLRLSELLNLKWGDFHKKEDGVSITGIGKGNKPFEILIAKDFYQELLALNKCQEKVFEISEPRVNDMMDRLRIKMDIKPERKIVFHSIRKAFGTLVYKTTLDLNAARVALRHESVMTTQIYLGITDYKLHNSVFSIDKLDENLYMKANHDVLLEAISQCNPDLRLNLNLKLQEILKTTNS